MPGLFSKGADMTKTSVVDPAFPVNYSSKETPPSYKCGGCGAGGCKLWRDYQCSLDYQTLLCAKCAAEEQKKNISDIDKDGKRGGEIPGYRTDQIGWRIPAVPTKRNDTFWGYTSVPRDGVRWWRRLPTLPS